MRITRDMKLAIPNRNGWESDILVTEVSKGRRSTAVPFTTSRISPTKEEAESLASGLGYMQGNVWD
jgi:hypothetical protein